MSKRISLGLLLLFFGFEIGINQQVVKAQTPTQVAPTITTKTICSAELGTAIDAVINRPLFSRVRWGVLIQNLGSNQSLYSRDAQNYFTPASNTKLLTTAAALQQLGANYRFRTSVYSNGDGVLRVVGRGDPSLSDVQLTALAKQLKQKGISEIRELIVEDSYRGDIVNSSWQWEDLLSGDGTPISSLNVNQNTFSFMISPQTLGKPLKLIWLDSDEEKQWQVINQSVTIKKNQPGSIRVTRDLKGAILRIEGELNEGSQSQFVKLPVLAPAEYFLQRFRRALTAEKITVKKAVVSNSRGTNKNEVELAAVQSPPLSELLMETNQISNNLFAEALLRGLAIKKTVGKNQGTADVGMEVLKSTLTQMEVDPTSYVLADGSGLSRKNLISPEALVQTLQAMAKSPQADAFRTSLPVAGFSGTLKNRFQNTPAMGIVQAKTGTMGGIVSLSGYVNAPKYSPVVFSIMVNQTEQPARIVRQGIDEIVVMLAQLQKC